MCNNDVLNAGLCILIINGEQHWLAFDVDMLL